VTAINPEKNTITIGGKSEVYASELIASEMNWISIEKPDGPIIIKARIRYRHRESEAKVTPTSDNEVMVKFTEPQMAPTPGQAVIFYDGDTVVGGGTISKVGNAGDLIQ